MSANFICPKCRNYINYNGGIVLKAVVENDKCGIILFNKELGDYKIQKNPNFIIKEGQRVRFFCPLCNKTLTAENLEGKLSRVIMIDSEGDEYDVLFSEVAGEHCTYKIKDGIVQTFGNDSDNYTNFFGADPNY